MKVPVVIRGAESCLQCAFLLSCLLGSKESKKMFSPSFLSSSFQELHGVTEMGHVSPGGKSSPGYSCCGGGVGAAEEFGVWSQREANVPVAAQPTANTFREAGVVTEGVRAGRAELCVKTPHGEC